MAQYNGVSASEIENSIVDALIFNSQMHCGTETNALPLREIFNQARTRKIWAAVSQFTENNFRAGGAHASIMAIGAAQDDATLADCIEKSNVRKIFSQLYDMLEFHRRNNTDGKGRAIVEALDVWGGRDAAVEPNPAFAQVSKTYVDIHKSRLTMKTLFGKEVPAYRPKQNTPSSSF